MIPFDQRHREATLVLVNSEGDLLGCLPAIHLSTPWFQEIAELVRKAEAQYGIRPTILRLLSVEENQPPALYPTYLAQVSEPVTFKLATWPGELDEQPLRMSYARLNGPAADLHWAGDQLRQQGYGEVQQTRQIRTWNLSSIWRLTTSNGHFWLKCIPPFFSHEGDTIKLLEDDPAPRLVAAEGNRILMQHLEGEDCYEATEAQMLHMVTTLVDLQWRWHTRLEQLQEAGVPEYSDTDLIAQLEEVTDLYRSELTSSEQGSLQKFIDTLPARLHAINQTNIPRTLVHGDYHPGNWRGTDNNLTILDWGDCHIGLPLMDMPALLERAGDSAAAVRSHWQLCWQTYVPGADIDATFDLILPLATAWRAWIFHKFLQNIEPSEHTYHESDPRICLAETAALLQTE